MLRLNPHAKATKRAAIIQQEKRLAEKEKVLNKKRDITEAKK